jgi:hypothetical protein
MADTPNIIRIIHQDFGGFFRHDDGAESTYYSAIGVDDTGALWSFLYDHVVRDGKVSVEDMHDFKPAPGVESDYDNLPTMD